MISSFTKFTTKIICKPCLLTFVNKCHGVIHLKHLLQNKKPPPFSLSPLLSEDHEKAVDIIKRYFLSEHVFVLARKMDLNDHALDEYILNMLKQGNSMYAKSEDGTMVGLCVNYGCSPADAKNLKKYAFYRQDANTKDFLYFMAKLQETPSLWEVYKQPKMFEIKMVTVLPEYRRLGLATMLVEKSNDIAREKGYLVTRMDCINPYDYKIAERCQLQCILKFSVHKVGEPKSFIDRNSEYNRCVQVYVNLLYEPERIMELIRQRQDEWRSLIE